MKNKKITILYKIIRININGLKIRKYCVFIFKILDKFEIVKYFFIINLIFLKNKMSMNFT